MSPVSRFVAVSIALALIVATGPIRAADRDFVTVRQGHKFDLAAIAAAARGQPETGADGAPRGFVVRGSVSGTPAAIARHSGSLALADNPSLGRIVWTANGDANSVSVAFLGLGTAGAVAPTAVIPTGKGSEPTNVTASADGLRAWVTLRGRGQVLPLCIEPRTGTLDVGQAADVGTEPVGIVLDSAQEYLYVANSVDGTVGVMDAARTRLVSLVNLGSGSWPFALAVKSAGAGRGAAERIYATQYFSPSRSNGFNNGGEKDDARVGKVALIENQRLIRTIDLEPFACFTINQKVIQGFPNMLDSITVAGKFGYVVSVGASPEGPVTFSGNTQAFVSVFSTETDSEVRGGAINLNDAVEGETKKGLFFNTPWGIAFGPTGTSGYVLSAASNVAVRVSVDATTGIPTIKGTATAESSQGIVRVPVGKNPRAIAFSADGKRAYVHNYIGRDVTVIDAGSNKAVATIPAAPLPTDTLERQVHRGQELFNTSLGDSTVDPAAKAPGKRMSTNGWGSCFSCHPFGWTDTIVWNFPTGPRKTLPLIGKALFNAKDPHDERAYNWTSERDEFEDFELNIRAVSSKNQPPADTDGNSGLIVGVSGAKDSSLGAPDIFNILTADGKRAKGNRGRSKDWDSIVAYIKTVRSPIAPKRRGLEAGRKVFKEAGCIECHGGPKWTSSRVPYDPLDAKADVPSFIAGGSIKATLRNVGSFITTELTATATPAKGAAGFNPPSLLGAWAFPPFFHNGRFPGLGESLEVAMVEGAKPHKLVASDAKVQARAQTLLSDARNVEALVSFLRSIDDSTPPVNPDGSAPGDNPTGGQPSPNPGPGGGTGGGTLPGQNPGGTPPNPGGSPSPGASPPGGTPGGTPPGGRPGSGGGSQGSTGKSGLQGIVFIETTTSGSSPTFRQNQGDRANIALIDAKSGASKTCTDVDKVTFDPQLGTFFTYRFADVAPGSYGVTVSRKGFNPIKTDKPLDLLDGQTLQVDAFLFKGSTVTTTQKAAPGGDTAAPGGDVPAGQDLTNPLGQ